MATSKEKQLVQSYVELIAAAQETLKEFAAYLDTVKETCRATGPAAWQEAYQKMYDAGLSDLLDGAPDSMHLDDLNDVLTGNVCKCDNPDVARNRAQPRRLSYCTICDGVITA